MVALTNFYENLKEANMRLRGTIVLYDGLPYYVHGVTNHMSDGIFRVYCEPIGTGQDMSYNSPVDPIPFAVIPYDNIDCGKAMDAYIVKYPQFGILRKHMNSPAFNKFRPFPLGMINYKGTAYHLERQPLRQTLQGLSSNMLTGYKIRLFTEKASISGLRTDSVSFRDMVLGQYPSSDEAIEKLLDPSISNEAVAFHRQCALVRGPVDTIFFAFRNDTVGYLPNNDFTKLRLAKNFKHLKESIEALDLFGAII